MTAPFTVPPAFAASYRDENAAAPAWLADLPRLAGEFLERWELRPDGAPGHGMASVVLPVTRTADGTPAVLKLQQVREETVGAATALRTWAGNGAVRLLAHDPATDTALLERLDASRPLSTLARTPEGEGKALRILAGLMARLTAPAAPPGTRRLADIAAAMLDEVPSAVRKLADPADRALLGTCASAVTELLPEPGDRLLHWDLHYDNVLAGEREPWLAIDPEPLAGDPGFDLWPALNSDPDPATVLPRFDLLTEALGLDRARAAGWTLARILQNALWDVADGNPALDPVQVAQAKALLGR
ncbi:hydroxyurea phosphotransferase [Streptomyces spiroverticillatus]|nr:aminoglycoside phosphotransferase family protein [Streptomyces finlayi]GHA07856.1 hydroxyurea phosphotransferase [Streptomyces spiroverticillatus]